jgi:hypothetical protein
MIRTKNKFFGEFGDFFLHETAQMIGFMAPKALSDSHAIPRDGTLRTIVETTSESAVFGVDKFEQLLPLNAPQMIEFIAIRSRAFSEFSFYLVLLFSDLQSGFLFDELLILILLIIVFFNNLLINLQSVQFVLVFLDFSVIVIIILNDILLLGVAYFPELGKNIPWC